MTHSLPQCNTFSHILPIVDSPWATPHAQETPHSSPGRHPSGLPGTLARNRRCREGREFMPTGATPDRDAPRGDRGSLIPIAIPGAVRSLVHGLAVGPCVMTAQFEGDRSGVRVFSVMPCATDPLMVALAVRRGHSIEPLIRDSRGFAICAIAPDDRLVLRKFPEDGTAAATDPFDSLSVMALKTGAPILKRAIWAFDCEVVRHFDLDADCEIYVGAVLDGLANRSTAAEET
jgi:flavin reductase (DIM6/NTAB) family NADH-FMN oxidoreductase RutF